MTTLAIQGISAFATGGVQALTSLAVSTAQGVIANALDNRVFEGPQLESFHLQTSRDGAPMPRVFGRVRLAGQVIWASQVRETVTEESVGGKGGGPVQRSYSYSISFAVGLCEGEILGVDRIWANGEPLSKSGLSVRVHTGSDSQGPDSVIAATERGPVPAFRGTAYIVFEDFPLQDYGARLPVINAEVVRASSESGRMERLIQSVNLLPGTGEFALSPTVVEETPTFGVTIPSNMNSFTGQADLITSLDQLQAELPNCRHVNVISAWFGTSTDAATCEIKPGVETGLRRLPDAQWQVGDETRSTAYTVSQDGDGRPNYGGTPSDDSLIACIRELKQRGFAVTLYPFLLMDMPGFPWRGRITASGPSAVQSFFGTDNDHRFRHHILHHARLAERAGGVDAIVIGSELTALMATRSGDGFPAVSAMRSLARAVRGTVRFSTQITYAADWSDYFGLQDGGDVAYHLDALWADDNIDAVGIDAYFPLSDWRDGEHLDAEIATRPHDIDYLRGNVEGGEGYDWFYASRADRDAQVRTPIDDPVYRYKDLRNWWGSAHTNRINGQPATPSPWVPKSKPIWLLEIGCPAVDKGANQPNVFYDQKSVDAALPYYSDGSRNDLIQRRYLEAFIGHYAENNEPGFVDLSRTSVWTWDARPYPHYPARTDVWSDGSNWARGHWLNGRTGLMPVADVVEELVRDSGLTDIDVSGVSGVIPGYTVTRPMSARAALGPLMQLYGIEMNERDGNVSFSIGGPDALTVTDAELVGQAVRSRADGEGRIRDVRLSYIDAARDYQLGSASARSLSAQSVSVVDIAVPAVLDEGFARHVARRELSRAHAGEQTLALTLPLATGLSLQTGDRLRYDGEIWAVDELTFGASVSVSAHKDLAEPASWLAGATPEAPGPITYAGPPQLLGFDLPGRDGISVGAIIQPFEPVLARGLGEEVELTAPLRAGATLTTLSLGPTTLRDTVNSVDVLIDNLSLASVTDGTNRFAVETALGWEVFSADHVELIAPRSYRLSNLLRGLDGSDGFMAEVPGGARIVWLGLGLSTIPATADWRGEVVTITGESASRTANAAEVVWSDLAGIPMSPVHLRWDGTTLSWIGRDPAFTDWTEDDSHLRYRVRLFRGEEVEVIDTTGSAVTPAPFERAEVLQIALDGRESLTPAVLNVATS